MSSLVFLTGFAAKNKLKTHCLHGHELKESNLVKWAYRKKGWRVCKVCNNAKTRRWKLKNKQYHIKWNKNNRDKVRGYFRKYELNNLEKRYLKNKRWREKNPDYQNKWRKNNPRSSNKYSHDLQDAMNNVRQRDKNTCQWFGCGLTFRQAPIQVHHIFPRKEYPDLELVEQYMICYCMNHHWLWHKYRGDEYAKLLKRAM